MQLKKFNSTFIDLPGIVVIKHKSHDNVLGVSVGVGHHDSNMTVAFGCPT